MGVFSNSTTALLYIKKQGGTFSAALHQEAQLLLRWTESWEVTLMLEFIMASNVVADSLSRRQQVLGSEWTLAQDVVGKVASDDRPLCHCPQLEAFGLFFAPE